MKLNLKDDIFNSYNCLGSCIGTILKKYFSFGLNLALHSRCQFFWSDLVEYDDTIRFTGESPFPFEPYELKKYLKNINNILNINITAVWNNKLENLDDIINDINKQGFSLVILNKYYIEEEKKYDNPKYSLTTYIITDFKDKGGTFRYFEPFGTTGESTDGHVNYETLLRARSKPSEKIYCPNGCRLEFNIEKLRSGNYSKKEYADQIIFKAVKSIIEYSTIYINNRKIDDVYYGINSIKLLADDMLKWPDVFDKNYYNRIIDCSRYLMFVEYQRKYFAMAIEELIYCLSDLDQSFRKIKKEIYKIVDTWYRIRLLQYLINARKQIGALKQVSKKLHVIADEEKEIHQNIIKILSKI